MVGRAVVHRNCWNWGSLLEWTAIEEEARGLWQSDLSGRKAVCYIAVIIYDKHFSVWDLPLNRNHRWCKLRGITSRHKTRQWGKLHGRLSQFGGCGMKEPSCSCCICYFFKASGYGKVVVGNEQLLPHRLLTDSGSLLIVVSGFS